MGVCGDDTSGDIACKKKWFVLVAATSEEELLGSAPGGTVWRQLVHSLQLPLPLSVLLKAEVCMRGSS